MSKQILEILKSIEKEATKTRKSIDSIEADLGTDRSDIEDLKKRIASMEDTISRLSRDLTRFQQKMGEKITEAVQEGIEPVGDLVENINEGANNGSIPITKDTAKSMKTSKWANKLKKKWKDNKLFGGKK